MIFPCNSLLIFQSTATSYLFPLNYLYSLPESKHNCCISTSLKIDAYYLNSVRCLKATFSKIMLANLTCSLNKTKPKPKQQLNKTFFLISNAQVKKSLREKTVLQQQEPTKNLFIFPHKVLKKKLVYI